jgi:hypothetical protein
LFLQSGGGNGSRCCHRHRGWRIFWFLHSVRPICTLFISIGGDSTLPASYGSCGSCTRAYCSCQSRFISPRVIGSSSGLLTFVGTGGTVSGSFWRGSTGSVSTWRGASVGLTFGGSISGSGPLYRRIRSPRPQRSPSRRPAFGFRQVFVILLPHLPAVFAHRAILWVP